MNNSKRNIHNSGPLGMLVNSGQIKKIEDNNSQLQNESFDAITLQKKPGTYFKTQAGLEFSEQELIYVNPKECEPWEYANRSDNELGDIDELIESIKTNKQLQPALIRNHPFPHGDIKYEIIFGRRRHIACLQLGIPFLAIRKELTNIQDAIAAQDAENKLRNDVSNYSNAVLYKKLISNGVFQTEKDLAKKLNISPSSLNDLMAFAKIPEVIANKIPNIHTLSKQIAVKLAQYICQGEEFYNKILNIADKIGTSINSLAKLDNVLNKNENSFNSNIMENSLAKTYNSSRGMKLFTLKSDRQGKPSIVIDKKIASLINLDDLCSHLSSLFEETITRSGYPDPSELLNSHKS